MRNAEMRKAILAIADAHGAKAEFERTQKGHWRAIIAFGPARRTVVFSGTPSDWRELRNTVAYVRRGISEMKSAHVQA
jgi:hypothetical protein